MLKLKLYFKEITLSLVFLGIVLGYSFNTDRFLHAVEQPLLRFYVKMILRQDIPKANLEIDFKDLSSIYYTQAMIMSYVEKPTESNVRIPSLKEYYPMDLVIGKQTFNGDVRLKGDVSDHFDSKQLSFKFKLKDNGFYHGMKQFTLQSYERRGGIFEWFYHIAMSLTDNVAIRYSLVDFSLNGEYLGLYALEESFDKYLVENNRYREGPVLKLDERYNWYTFLLKKFKEKQVSTPYVDAMEPYFRKGGASTVNSFMVPFKLHKTYRDSTLKNAYLRAHSLYAGFRDGQLSVEDVFDVEALTNYLILRFAFGAIHGGGFGNIRFYYNPVTGKLSPIAYDGDPIPISFKYQTFEALALNNWFYNRIFLDESYYLYFISSLSDAMNGELSSLLTTKFEAESGVPFRSNWVHQLGNYVIKQFPDYVPFFIKRRFIGFFLSDNLSQLYRLLRTDNVVNSRLLEGDFGQKVIRIANDSYIPFSLIDARIRLLNGESFGFCQPFDHEVVMPKQFDSSFVDCVVPDAVTIESSVSVELVYKDMLSLEKQGISVEVNQ